MRILLLNQYYHPDLAPTAQLAADLGAELVRRGHQVTAVASARPYSGSGFHRLVDEHAGVRIFRIPATALGRQLRATRLLDYASYVAGLVPLLLAVRADVIVALSTPPLLACVALLPQLLQGARVVYWAMDVYPELALALGALRAGGVAARVLAGAARQLARRADAIVALDDAMRTRLVFAGAAPERVEVIDNWVDGDAVRPRDGQANALRQELRLDGFTVSYSGNMGLGHDFETLLSAMHLLADDEVSWLFIGDGPRRQRFQADVERAGLRRVRFLDYRRLDELPISMTAADASIVTMQANVGGLLAPSKLYAILAAGLPLVYIGPPEGRSAELIAHHGVGVGAANRDAAGLAAGIRRLQHDPGLRREMGQRARRVFDERFSRAAALERHCQLIARVGAQPC
jgi:putative colanic acid biosynthesis glycosyltransferase WcaI